MRRCAAKSNRDHTYIAVALSREPQPMPALVCLRGCKASSLAEADLAAVLSEAAQQTAVYLKRGTSDIASARGDQEGSDRSNIF